ncbi:MAG: ASCH domain-containing protein [Kordiimonadales bacterium]|nr:MAG: ASCH domain-containing protein [Kordiimonadales bacterium]
MTAAADPKQSDLLSFSFGDSPELADELLALVMNGRKTATCYSPELETDELSKIGERQIVLDGHGEKACVIEITAVDFARFCDVSADFAFLEGEGDRSLENWRADHEAYFRRQGVFSQDMKLVCEQFRVTKRFS